MIDSLNITIRDATINDMAAVQQIYAYHVLNGLGTFEEIPPTAEEMGNRFSKVTQHNYPYLIAELDQVIIGYAYGGFFRERSAFRFTVEDSVYISPDYVGFGVGKKLLNELICICQERGFRQIFAIIGDSDNLSSRNLHHSCGFSMCGIMKDAGFKFNRWVDVVIMERSLDKVAL